MTDHDDNRLVEYLYGEMPDGEAHRFEQSLDLDASMRSEVEDLSALLGTIRQIEDDYGPDYAGIQGDGREVGGFRVDAATPPGGPLVVLYSEDLDVTLARVREAGGQVVREPFDFPGGRRFHFHDPSGNELAVWGSS